MDQRVQKLAHLLVHYSNEIKKGDLLKIQGEAVTMPLIKAIYEEAVKVGAYPYVQIRVPECEEVMLKHGDDDQLSFINPLAKLETDKMDALISLWGSTNTKYLSGIKPERQAFQRKAMRPVIHKLFTRMGNGSLRWVGSQFPTMADAQDAEMSLADYENFVYGAGHLDSPDPTKHWLTVKKEQERLVKILNQIDQLHVRSNDTDLKMRVKGRKWISCHGTENFPDGEIFTGPIEDTAEGHIHYSYPAVYMGREVTDVRLTLKKGKVVKEEATKNLEYLTAMLNMDKGARYVGEFAIGTNYEIQRFSRNTLFDEKIGGTCHMAVGASIPESGGKNKSSLHWDMVCDLRKGSEITGDGKVIYRNGRFTI